MNWTCQQFEERLTDYLDDALSVADRSAFLAHEAECARCKPLLAQVSGMVTAIHHVEPIEPPQGLIRRILDETVPQKEERGWFGLAWLTPRFAMGALTVALFILMVYPVTGIEISKLTWSDLKPVNIYHATNRRATLMYARGVKFVNGLRVLHEIQTRLQPADAEAVPVRQEQKRDEDQQNKSEKEKNGSRDQNRAFEPKQIPVTLAGIMSGAGQAFLPVHAE